jgi:hypothetical protein
VCYVSRILEGCPGKHPALKNWRKVAMWKSCTWAVCPLEGVLWHPLGIHVWAVMAANKKQNKARKETHESSKTGWRSNGKETRKAEHELGENRWAVST